MNLAKECKNSNFCRKNNYICTTMVFKKNRQRFRPKLANISENNDRNIVFIKKIENTFCEKLAKKPENILKVTIVYKKIVCTFG
jgi:hypothetical protein